MYQDPFVDKMPTTQAGMGEQCRAICNENSKYGILHYIYDDEVRIK